MRTRRRWARKFLLFSQSVSYFTVPPRAHPSTGSQSGSFCAASQQKRNGKNVRDRRLCVSGKENLRNIRRVINTRSWKFSATVLRHTARTRIAFMHYCHLTRAPPPPALAHDLACAAVSCARVYAVATATATRSLAPRKTSTCGSCSVNARPGTSCLPLACPLPRCSRAHASRTPAKV